VGDVGDVAREQQATGSRPRTAAQLPGPPLAVVIGASAGGPSAIEKVISALPWKFPVPIAVCQHMTEGATSAWAERLNDACHLRVVEARFGEAFAPHRVYIAPTGKHMLVRGTAENPYISLESDRAGRAHVPAIDELMNSIAEVFGQRSLGVVLTGMGSDGAEGLLAIHQAGGVTLAQPTDSAFMRSMPEAAADAGAVGEFVPLEKMADVIMQRVSAK
jgi:two-component system, chemotaxis family, protein-glutamate methylesterase/glutaminase